LVRQSWVHARASVGTDTNRRLLGPTQVVARFSHRGERSTPELTRTMPAIPT
jgi:hypothetical protein